ncbi:MAG: hypothetical protein IPL73_21525 [Candidatus Obscuribacter sp.]|nr:hypothetical protein [Candidatus Obscuribacter sp.]
MTKNIVLKVSQCAIARASLLTVALLAAASISATYVTLQALGKEHRALNLASKSTDKDSLPPPLKALMHATTFDDSAAGESGQSQNYKNYSAAVGQIQALETKDLQNLLTQGSPAGRLYAAVLLKQSNRVGNNESFAKLLSDDADVTYLSGCKGSSYKVKEIAAAFIKDGSFNNFKFSLYCKLKTPVTSGSEQAPTDKQMAESFDLLSSTNVLEHFQQGDSNQPSRAWQAFQILLKQGTKAKPHIDQMLKAKSPATRLYGVILLKQLDTVKASSYLKSWQSDQSQVVYSQGCAKSQTTVADLAQRLLKGQDLVMLKDPNL